MESHSTNGCCAVIILCYGDDFKSVIYVDVVRITASERTIFCLG